MVYKPRKIEFQRVANAGPWRIKIYSITMHEQFGAVGTLEAAIANLPEWLAQSNGFDDSVEYMAFLIIHEGNEGIFTILNWWVGQNMLNTHIFFSAYDDPAHFRRISGNGLAPCIWELEVINRERLVWIEHVMQRPEPDYKAYLEATFYAVR